MPSFKAVPGAAVPGAAVPGNDTPYSAVPGVTLPAAPQVTVTAWPPSVAGVPGVALPAAQVAVTAPAPGFATANVQVVNQWAATFAQPATFGTTPPALQSVSVPLTPAGSVGGGTGTPTAGNWLFCVVGMSEQPSRPGFTVGVADDIHSFWRPGNETASTWAVSAQAGLTRTAIWYTANTARAASNVYVAPSGAFGALTVLVVEVANLGPWDTVTGISTNYAAAATSLGLSLGAPSGTAFLLGAAAGDSTAAGQAFAPASWTALHTTSATNGTDHTCDSVLTSAWITTSGGVSVAASAASAANLSGAVIGVLTAAPSPVPASQNPAWPYMKLEMAFGGGFQTPQDQLTWTDVSARGWSWNETTGIQYQLGQIQATDLDIELDNNDNLLGADNPGSYWYTQPGWAPQAAVYDALVTAGSPLAWWKLADASGSGTAADSSGNGHTGTATAVTFANASQAVSGNNSASFASGSTSHVLTTYNPSLSAVTVECWVNLNGITQGTFPRLFANSNTASDNKGFEFVLAGASNNTPGIWFGNGTAFASVVASSALPATGWTYLAATWDGAQITLYVNGVAQGTAALSGPMAAGTANIGIGYDPAGTFGYFSGLLAECAVYGTALAAGQAGARYMAGPAVTGTPVRIRAAAAAIGGVTVNRWYCIQRNIETVPQQVTGTYRRYIPATATDIWSTLSASGPPPYRGEVSQDAPEAWWPMDDQPLSGGVQPTSLRNAATGNTTVMTINAASGGVTAGHAYTTGGTDATANNPPGASPSIAVSAVGQQQGWMYGDPQSSPASYATGNPVTSSPGSAAWQQSGLQGSGGSNGWFLAANDPNFPALSGGATFGLWFNAGFFGSATGWKSSLNSYFDLAGQPYSVITLATLATASAPVAILQLDLSGHLILITYNGGTPTSHTIYSSSDLRSGAGSWHHVMLTTDRNNWTVYVNGGLTAAVSGTSAGMTSAWSWLIIGADLGSSGGSTLSAAAHMGNVAYSHAQVFPSILPAWRVRAHYCAAATAFGMLPAPQAVSLSSVISNAGTAWTPDGTEFNGSYGPNAGATFTFSAVAVAKAGSYTSAPSARAVLAGIGQVINLIQYGNAVWVSWSGLAPSFGVYTAASANAETNAATACGSGDSFTSGFGATASGHGVCQTAAGTGASPPSSASPLGDTVQQRLERILGYGDATYPGRCIDPASLAVQAATDIGGQQAGPNLQNISASDGGMLYVDNLGYLTYWQKSHLAAQYSSPAWTITPAAGTGQAPYYASFQFIPDPQRVWNSIGITPFSPDGASLPVVTPANAAAVNASQKQYGTQPKQITSYLQPSSEMQNQADWLAEYFSTLHVRADNMKIDAAPDPALWPVTLGMNVGDVASIQNWQVGGGAVTGTFRVTRIRRAIRFGGQDGETEGSLTITADWEPPSYWT